MGSSVQELRQRKIRWLQRFRQLDSEIVSYEGELDYWRERGTRVTMGYLERTRGGPGMELGDIAARIVDIQTELCGKLSELVRLQREISGAIEGIPEPRFRQILRLRFLQGMTMERIASQMGYSWRQVQRLFNQALDALEIEFP